MKRVYLVKATEVTCDQEALCYIHRAYLNLDNAEKYFESVVSDIKNDIADWGKEDASEFSLRIFPENDSFFTLLKRFHANVSTDIGCDFYASLYVVSIYD